MALSAKEIKAHRDAVHIRQALIWNKCYGYDAEIRKLMGITNGFPKEGTACNGTGKSAKRARQREKFFEEFPNCYYCKVLLAVDNQTLDHFIPKSRGGSDSYANLVTCCKKCNREKGANLPDGVEECHANRKRKKTVQGISKKRFERWSWCREVRLEAAKR